MSRAKKAVASRARRKKVLNMAKGYRSGRRRLYRSAREAVELALCFAYRDRKVLADLAIFDPQGFARVVEMTRSA